MAMNVIDRLDPDKIAANLATKFVGGKVVVFESTSSTNDIAAEYVKSGAGDGLAVFAENQSGGRGRGGNKWFSRPYESLLCSVVVSQRLIEGGLLALATAVASAETIGAGARIKWPNDILIEGKKIAGILVEKKGDSFIVGIGINCHQRAEAFGAELAGRATSIDIETKNVCDRVTIARRLISNLDEQIKTAQSSAEKITERWQNLSIHLGHRVTLLFDGRKINGTCLGVDPQKGLILRLDGGAVRMFDAAQSSAVS